MNGNRHYLLILVLGLGALAASCGKDGSEGLQRGTHPLSAQIAGIRPHLQGLNGEEREAIDNFVRTGTPATGAFELRRVCRYVGQGLVDADREVIADFVLAAREYLYDDFFRVFEVADLLSLAEVMRTRPGLGEIDRLRIGAVVGTGKGNYRGSLKEAMQGVSFMDAVAPRSRNAADLVPPEDAPVEVYAGAAELLRLDRFVKDGARLDLAVTVYRTALDKWPGDAVLTAGLVSLYLENEDLYEEELRVLLDKAEALDRNNAAFTYLRAARYLRAGQDEQALEAFGIAASREKATFYELERARRTAKYLESIGNGRLSSLLTAYRTTSMSPYFDLKDLTNRVVKRSYEYESADDVTSLESVIDVPVVVARQMGATPRMLFTEIVRCRILVMGLNRKAGLLTGDGEALTTELKNESTALADRIERIERAAELCSGQEAWGRLHDILGEERFLEYVEKIIYGDEASFLARCGDATCLADAVVMLDAPPQAE